MDWVIEIVFSLGVFILFAGEYYSEDRQARKTVGKTADGYHLSVETAYSLQKKANTLTYGVTALGQEKEGLVSIETKLMSSAMIGLFLVATAITDNTGYFIPIVGFPFIALCYWLSFELKREVKKAKLEIGKVTLLAPEETKDLGKYVTNPFASKLNQELFLSTYQIIQRKKQERQDYFDQLLRHKKDVWAINKSLEPLPQSQIDKLDERADRVYENSILNYQKELEEIVSKNGEEFFTNELPVGFSLDVPALPEETAKIEPKMEVELALVEDAGMPHHINVIKGISLNTNLPDDVRERANRFIESYEEEQMKKEHEEELAQALLELATVEKYYGKESQLMKGSE